MTEATQLGSVEDYFAAAQGKVPAPVWDSIFEERSGIEGWRRTTWNNVEGFSRLKLRPRVLVDVSNRNLETTVLGTRIRLPVVIAPSGSQQRWHVDGELATARGGARAGTVSAFSTLATYSMEEVRASTNGPLWFQLYIFRDRRWTRRLLERAEEAGYCAIVVTVDMPGTNSPERDATLSGYDMQQQVNTVPSLDPNRLFANFQDLGVQDADLPARAAMNQYFDSALTWADLEWLRGLTSLPIVVKGIQTGDDARLCREHGADAIVASNHGGFAIANAQATIVTLPEIVDEAGALEVYLDGGIRRGTDILKSLALGARAVLIGRAQLCGLIVDGEDGIVHVLEILRHELDQAMRYCGVADVTAVDAAVWT